MKQITNISKLESRGAYIQGFHRQSLMKTKRSSLMTYKKYWVQSEFFVERKSILDQNISNLCGIVWFQCTPSLKEYIIGLDGYRVKFNEYNCLCLFQHLKSSTSGADRYQYEYLSYVISPSSLLTMRQKYNESTEGISERLDSALLNLKLVGGNMNPKGL